MSNVKPSQQASRLISNLVSIGDRITDTEQVKVQHHLLVYMGLFMGLGGLVWGTISIYFQLFLPGSIPYGYSILTIVNFAILYQTKNFQRARFVQVILSLILPFMFQWSLGGFVSSGAMMLWSMVALIGSITFYETKWSIRWVGMYLLLTIFSGFIDGYVTTAFGLGLPPSTTTVFFVLNITIISAIVFGLGIYLLNLLRSSQAGLEKLVVERTDELNTLSVNLEQRVADRTRALEISAEVSRSLASILDPAQLASTVVNQVRDAFNYYYAQIYLFDATGENLVLTAGTGEAGAVMLKRRHSLPKGRGLVGRAAETKESILVSDTSQDPNWLPNDLLPDTKAEAAIPIAIGDQVLGVLDVQDNLTNDINPADITLLESLANQVAISLQNASSYARAEEALQEAQSLVENAPEAILIVDVETGLFSNPNENALKLFGLSREELSKTGPVQTSPLTQPDGRNSAEKASELINETIKGTTSIFEWTLLNKQGQEILCEVRLVRLPGKTARVRASITDISGRKRVEEQIRRRAQQQESLNLITQRIQSATTIESALQITARELGRALGQKPTLVTLAPGNLNGEREIGS